MKYSSHWFATILAAVALHFFAAIIFQFALPKIFPAQIHEEINLVDVELVDDAPIIDEEILPIEPQKNSTAFEFAPIELPPLEVPKFDLPEIPKLPEPAPKPPVPPKEEPQKIFEPVEEPQEKQILGSDPITISAVYPQKNFGFQGYVSVSVTIGKDGKIKNAEVIMPSGIADVDNIALDSAKQWTFKPALDQNNKPMERIKIITFDFTKISDE